MLCLAGSQSLRMAVLASGFGGAWLLATVFGASTIAGLLVGLAGAGLALAAVWLMPNAVALIVGCIVGTVVGAKLFVVLGGAGASWLLAAIFVPAVAVVGGLLAIRFERGFLEWGTAVAGSALVVSGIGVAVDHPIGMLHAPTDLGESLLVAAVWALLALAGHAVQHRLPRRVDAPSPAKST